MENYIKNICNPPLVKETGQIWYSGLIKDYLLIIDDNYAESSGVVRTVLLSRENSVNDGFDVIISTKEDAIFKTDKVSLRFTAGPTAISELDTFVGNIGNEKLKQIIESLKISANKYDKIQSKILAEIVDELLPLRVSAINEYENLELSGDGNTIDEDEIEETYYYSLAADDIGAIEDREKFWKFVKKNKEKNVTIFKDEEAEIQINMLLHKDKLFLLVYSVNNILMNDIILKVGNSTVTPKHSSLETEGGRVFTFFDYKLSAEAEELIIEFTLNKTDYKKIKFIL